MRIGILDDDPAICGLLHETLERYGHVASVYHTGEDFLKQIIPEKATPALKPFDAVLIDLCLPAGISGVDALRYVRLFFPTLPILVISAVDAGDLEFIQEKFPGVKAFQKPFKLHHLLAAIETP